MALSLRSCARQRVLFRALTTSACALILSLLIVSQQIAADSKTLANTPTTAPTEDRDEDPSAVSTARDILHPSSPVLVAIQKPPAFTSDVRFRETGSAVMKVTNAVPKVEEVEVQLQQLEAKLKASPDRASEVSNFDFQRNLEAVLNATTLRSVRPHHVSFAESLSLVPLPVPQTCPSSIRPDLFCAPNLGRDWLPGTRVFPISYSLPEELFPLAPPPKDKDCADIVPRERGTYKFSNEQEYMQEYSRSYYCITYKKGGWDVLRHYEIISAGCMPYMIDVEYAPLYSLYHLPKKLLLEARDLPGVTLNCSAVRVTIDHRVFPKERYLELLQELLDHARRFLSTKAMAQFVLNATGKPLAKRVLYLAAAKKKAPLRAQGNYNSWTLFHGFRSLLGDGAVDPYEIPFLYHQSKEYVELNKKKLYGMGFGYAFRLPPRPNLDRGSLLEKIEQRYFDLIIYGDPSSLVSTSSGQFKFLKAIQKSYRPSEIVFVHAPDIAYPRHDQQAYTPSSIYQQGTVFQREIMDCSYYLPASKKSEAMKRCVWYHNKNCFDDVNVQSTLKEKQLQKYVWDHPEV